MVENPRIKYLIWRIEHDQLMIQHLQRAIKTNQKEVDDYNNQFY